ncbi:glycosyltransferase [Caldibacillus lycopersici]|uniref:Glycosyltransferase n=1 Tax=Perspicuibacillus lycopersici TaxID=1325689 RepID=A0AAE3IRY9_9BACI|nr:glycosyltransferase [Perspicuibacillus lycopersici]MCU9612321.1 glycosyltransferase [Perspicuibacillus lycopersici]
MKKKMLIMMNAMGYGGVESALLNLLFLLDKEKLDITILFVKKEGELLEKIPNWIKTKEIQVSDFDRELLDYGNKEMLKRSIRKRQFRYTCEIITTFFKRKIYNWINKPNDRNEARYRFFPVVEDHYDVALDFYGHPSVTTYYIVEKVSADIKATWLHRSDIGNEIKGYGNYYKKYNRIFGVSNAAKEKFLEVFPELAEKCITLYNILLPEVIEKKSQIGKGFTDKIGGMRLLSVGRLAIEKGFDIAIEVAEKLKKDGYEFKWYVIGEGAEHTNLKKLIMKKEVADCFILLGASDNPYPFFQQCDIYIQTSRAEGYCITLAEARILKKPIITTNFLTAKEQIMDGETGIIAEFSVESILEGVKKLLTDEKLRRKLAHNVSYGKADYLIELEKFYTFVESTDELQLLERKVT